MKIKINSRQLNVLAEQVMNESYNDKVLDIKKYLDGKYMRGQILKNDNGDKKTIATFIQLTDKGLPTKDQVMFDDVFYKLQQERKKIFGDDDERDEFLKKAIKAWYDKKINDRGNISP